MLTQEQVRILKFLRRRIVSPLADVTRRCVPGASSDLVQRALDDLEWHGYVIVFYDEAGQPTAVQTTDRGRESAG